MGDSTDRIRKAMSSAICAFAATGDPNNDETPVWKPVTADCFNTMVFDEKIECKEDFDKKLDDIAIATGKAPAFGGMSAFGDPDGVSTADWMF